MLPKEETFALKKDGIVAIGWQKLALVQPQSDKSVNIQFNNDTIGKYKLDKALIRQKFEAAWSAAASEVEWSV